MVTKKQAIPMPTNRVGRWKKFSFFFFLSRLSIAYPSCKCNMIQFTTNNNSQTIFLLSLKKLLSFYIDATGTKNVSS